MVWYTLYSRTPGGEAQGWNGNTLRQAVPVSAYNIGAPPTGTQVRVTFHAGPGLVCNINESWFAHAGTSNISFDGTQVQIKSGTSNFFTVPAGGLLLSDPVNYAFDKTKPIVISTDMVNHPTNVGRGTDPDIGFYFQTSGAANTTTVTGTEQTDPATGAHFQIWPKVEVFFTDPAGNATCTLTKNLGQVDPTSGTTVKFFAQFNKGVTGFTAADVDLSSSTVTWQGGSPTVSVAGQDFAFIISVSGMLTIGNIVMRIPAGAVAAVADGAPNIASGTVTVAWNPDIIGDGPNVYEVAVVGRNLLRIEARDPQVQLGADVKLATGVTGALTFPVTNVADNGWGAIRITTTAAADYPNFFIQNMTASPVSNGAGGQRIRCTIYDTNALPKDSPGGPVTLNLYIINALGTLEANNRWNFVIIDSTHIDLTFAGSISSPGAPSAFVNTYLGNGMIWVSDHWNNRAIVHSVTGTTEANGCWPVMRSGVNTLDYMDSPTFVHSYAGGGTLAKTYTWCDYPNPTKGGAIDQCIIVGRTGKRLRFKDGAISVDKYLQRNAAKVTANYSITGGLSITNMYLKSKPYKMGFLPATGYDLPSVSFRHYIYLKFNGNLVSGNTYTVLFPAGTSLPPKTFTFNDKLTRCVAIHVDQNGHRPADPGKLGYLSEWVPDHGAHGEVDYSAVTAWHLINSAGTVVQSYGAPVLRVTPTTREGQSYDGPSSAASRRFLVGDRGPVIKVVSIPFVNNPTVTVEDASSLTNGDLISFVNMWHRAGGRPGAPPGSEDHLGMWQVSSDQASNPLYLRVVNKVGNTFQLGTVKGVAQGGATVANGGSGYSVGNKIMLESTTEGIGVRLEVLTVSGGAVTSVRVVPNEQYFNELSYAIAPISGAQPWSSNSSGKIEYPYTIPTNPRPQVSSTGGTGATFNLTWTNNPWDRTAYEGGFPSGNPDVTAQPPSYDGYATLPPMTFDVSISDNQGNIIYKINEFGNRASTNVYGLDYSNFTTTGDYRIWIPNIGVSDVIHISESRWWRASRFYLMALYHQRQGCARDGRFNGYVTGPGTKPGPNQPVYKSYLPYCLSNYTVEPFSTTIPDVNQGQYLGGGYGYWIRGSETGTAGKVPAVQFGSHQDAGDYDQRINETCWGYYQILESYEGLPPTARASLVNQGTPTCLEAGLDPVIFAGTNGISSPLVEVIWGLENTRSSQEPNGAVSGGTNYGEGLLNFETSDDWPRNLYTWYPDPVCSFNYAFVAAKLARLLIADGFTTLGNTYRTSAIAAYDWAVSIITNTATRDAWFAPTKLRAGWSTLTYDTAMTNMINYCARERVSAASSLYALTGSTTYKTVVDAFGPLGAVDVRGAFGAWEYAFRSPSPNAAIAANTIQLYKDFAAASLFTNMDAPDVSYVCGQSAGIWTAGTAGTANSWILNTPTLTFAALAWTRAGTAPDLALAAKCRKNLQLIAQHRQGANQLGLCLTNGLGVRHNLSSLHQDSAYSGQLLPWGIGSECWINNFGILPLTFGDSQIDRVAHPQYEPTCLPADPTFIWREIYPYWQLAWPRWEMFMEINDAVEMSEFTTQQQVLPAYATTIYLHGFDGNAASGALSQASVELASSSNPSIIGSPISFTCTVSGASGTPTGTVIFTADGATIGTVTLSGGVAQVTTSTLSEGIHTISAAYLGNVTYDPSSTSLSQDVRAVISSKVNPKLVMRARLHA